MSDWAAGYEPVPGVKLRGHVWWCEDEWCDCTQAKIEAVTKVTTTAVPHYRFATLWEGEFHTDGESGATTELNREARRLRRHHQDLHRLISWPWDRAAPQQVTG